MSRTAELERQVSFEDVAKATPARETARIVPLRQPAPSDRAAGMEAVAGNGSAAWQRGLVTPADIPTSDTIPSDWSRSYAIYMAARTNRAFVLGELAAVAMQIVADFMHDVAER